MKRRWLALVTGVLAFTLGAARCDVEVGLGIDPGSDAGRTNGDAGSDGEETQPAATEGGGP